MSDDSQDYKMIVVPSYLNPGAPEGESLVLVFTIDELEWARRRGESVIRNRKTKGANIDELLERGLKIS